jgi:hypothetical protein
MELSREIVKALMPFLGRTSSLARVSDMATIVGWTKTMSYTLSGSIFEMISACSGIKDEDRFFKHTQPALSDNKSTLISRSHRSGQQHVRVRKTRKHDKCGAAMAAATPAENQCSR